MDVTELLKQETSVQDLILKPQLFFQPPSGGYFRNSTFKMLGSVIYFLVFLKDAFCSLILHLFDHEYSNIVKYYNLKQLFLC